MANEQLGMVLRHLRGLLETRDLERLPDGELLERFTSGQTEAAFTVLVRRHGRMVLGVCRRVLHNLEDAEDAFQATFLVLFRKARSLDRRGSLANWLYTVAYRAAFKAKAERIRRYGKERQVQEMPEVECSPQDSWQDLRSLLDQEVNRLPHKYRAPIILCYFAGNTHEEAARLLGWPTGTLKGRLVRARELLRIRLTRRGITLSTGLLATLVAEDASASVPPYLLHVTLRAILFWVGKRTSAGVTSATVTTLAEGVLRTMLVMKLKIAATCALALGVVFVGVGTLTHQAWAERKVDHAGHVKEVADSVSRKEAGSRAAPGQDRPPAYPLLALEPATDGKRVRTTDERFKAEEVIERTFPTGGSPRVVVETFNGAIEVIRGSNGIVKARVVKKSQGESDKAAKEDLQHIQVAMTRDGDTIRISAHTPDEKSKTQRGAVVELQVPSGVLLDLCTRNGTETARMQGTVKTEPGKGFRLRTKNDTD